MCDNITASQKSLLQSAENDLHLKHFAEAVEKLRNLRTSLDEEGSVSNFHLMHIYENNIGICYSSWKKYENAHVSFKIALDTMIRHCYCSVHNIAPLKICIAYSLVDLKKYNDANLQFEEALHMLEESKGSESDDVDKAMFLWGKYMNEHSQFVISRRYLEICLRIREKKGNAPNIALALYALGIVHLNIGNEDVAEAMMLKGLHLNGKTHGYDNPMCKMIWGRLDQMYLQDHHYNKALKLLMIFHKK